MKATLERLESTDQGTFGRIYFGKNWLYTGELPDRDNATNISCIPTGTYDVLWTYSPAFKRYMYLVTSVTGRSGIRIHSANLMGDHSKGFRSHLYGCIAFGEKRGYLDNQKAILVSRPAVSFFEDTMERKPFTLEIKNEF